MERKVVKKATKMKNGKYFGLTTILFSQYSLIQLQ
jgi:hypothetical protein